MTSRSNGAERTVVGLPRPSKIVLVGVPGAGADAAAPFRLKSTATLASKHSVVTLPALPPGQGYGCVAHLVLVVNADIHDCDPSRVRESLLGVTVALEVVVRAEDRPLIGLISGDREGFFVLAPSAVALSDAGQAVAVLDPATLRLRVDGADARPKLPADVDVVQLMAQLSRTGTLYRGDLFAVPLLDEPIEIRPGSGAALEAAPLGSVTLQARPSDSTAGGAA